MRTIESEPAALGGGGGVTDHGALTGLGDDDHTQYVLHTDLPSVVDHDGTTNYVLGQHRIINDAGVALTELWSSTKINTELAAIIAAIPASGDIDHDGTLNYAVGDHLDGPIAAQTMLVNPTSGSLAPVATRIDSLPVMTVPAKNDAVMVGDATDTPMGLRQLSMLYFLNPYSPAKVPINLTGPVTHAHAAADEFWITADATAGAITVNLDSIATATNGQTVVIHIPYADPTNTVTIALNGTDEFDGSTDDIVIAAPSRVTLKADNTASPDQWRTFVERLSNVATTVHVTNANYTLEDGVETVILNENDGGTYTVTMPAISAANDTRKVTIILKELGSGSYRVQGTGTDRVASFPTYIFDFIRQPLQLQADNIAAPKDWQPRYHRAPSSQVSDSSLAGGPTVDDSLDSLQTDLDAAEAAIVALDTDDIANVSTVTGTSSSDALEHLDAQKQELEEIFQAIKTTDQTLTAAWAALTAYASTTYADGDFSFNTTTGELTVSYTGDVELGYTVAFMQSAGSNRSTPGARLGKDIGAGWAATAGTQLYTYTRNTTDSYGFCSDTIRMAVTSGDKFRVEVEYANLGGGATVVAFRGNLKFWARKIER